MNRQQVESVLVRMRFNVGVCKGALVALPAMVKVMYPAQMESAKKMIAEFERDIAELERLNVNEK